MGAGEVFVIVSDRIFFQSLLQIMQYLCFNGEAEKNVYIFFHNSLSSEHPTSRANVDVIVVSVDVKR